MDLNSAYATLGLSRNADEKEVKKAFRDLSKKYHPDQNKDKDADKKYKEITEAYNFINNPSEHDQMKQNPFGGESFGGNPFGGFPFNININGFDFGGFGNQQKMRHSQSIVKEIELTFEESILGKNVKIKVDRTKGCDDCGGDGNKLIDNGCKDCGGRGQKVQQSHGFISVVECQKCHGQVKHENCKTCFGKGDFQASSEYDIKIPGGVVNDNILKMQNAGHFIGNMQGAMLHSDVLVKIKVKAKPGFTFEDGVVKTKCDISLLDALKGTKLKIDTVLGEKEIEIKSGSKDKDKIIINKVGVNKIGNQEVLINVVYPENTDKLIEFLQNG